MGLDKLGPSNERFEKLAYDAALMVSASLIRDHRNLCRTSAHGSFIFDIYVLAVVQFHRTRVPTVARIYTLISAAAVHTDLENARNADN